MNYRRRLVNAYGLSENRWGLAQLAQSSEQIVPVPFRGQFSDRLLFFANLLACLSLR
jgi:hypothetical protein